MKEKRGRVETERVSPLTAERGCIVHPACCLDSDDTYTLLF